MNKKRWYILGPILLVVLIVFDQLTKYLARQNLADGDFKIIDGFFSFRYVTNKGAAWGMLQGKVDILSIVSILLVGAVCYFYIKTPEDKKFNKMRFLSVCVVAGAFGNLIDRIFMGEVTDFLYFELIDFPIFNVADIYITVAMFVFIFLMLFYYKDDDLDFISFKKKISKEPNKEEKKENEEEN